MTEYYQFDFEFTYVTAVNLYSIYVSRQTCYYNRKRDSDGDDLHRARPNL